MEVEIVLCLPAAWITAAALVMLNFCNFCVVFFAKSPITCQLFLVVHSLGEVGGRSKKMKFWAQTSFFVSFSKPHGASPLMVK